MRSLLTLWMVSILFHVSLWDTQSNKPELGSTKPQNTESAQQITDNATSTPARDAQLASVPTAANAVHSSYQGHEESSNSSLIIWFTGAIALFSLIQCGAMVSQYCVMRKQAIYTRSALKISNRNAIAASNAAVASKLGARAAVNAERAWLRVTMNQYPNQRDERCLVVHNDGKTAARVTGYCLGAQHIDVGSNEAIHPEERQIIPFSHWVQTKASDNLKWFNIVKEMQDSIPPGNIPSANALKVFYGLVEYEALIEMDEYGKISRRHKTYFWYEWSTTTHDFVSKPEYTRYT